MEAKKFSFTDNLLVKNIGLNYIGQAVLFVVFIFTVPYVVKGTDRYGIYPASSTSASEE
jgi:hypothetical protein